MIFHKPHPKKLVPEVAKKANDLVVIDPQALVWHSYICPPLSVVGAAQYNLLARVSYTQMWNSGALNNSAAADISGGGAMSDGGGGGGGSRGSVTSGHSPIGSGSGSAGGLGITGNNGVGLDGIGDMRLMAR
jgi:hypothetical protein